MVVVRCSKRLFDRLRMRPVDTDERSTTVLGGWHATVLRKGSVDWIVCLNDETFLPVVVRGAPFATFTERFADAAAEVLREMGVAAELVEAERAAMREVAIGKSKDRSVIATLRQWCSDASMYDELGLELSLKLAETPSLVHPLTFADRALKAAFARVSPANDIH